MNTCHFQRICTVVCVRRRDSFAERVVAESVYLGGEGSLLFDVTCLKLDWWRDWNSSGGGFKVSLVLFTSGENMAGLR